MELELLARERVLLQVVATEGHFRLVVGEVDIHGEDCGIDHSGLLHLLDEQVAFRIKALRAHADKTAKLYPVGPILIADCNHAEIVRALPWEDADFVVGSITVDVGGSIMEVVQDVIELECLRLPLVEPGQRRITIAANPRIDPKPA